MLRKATVCSLALAALLLVARPADACSCVAGFPICQTFWQTDAVFSGEVLDISDGQPREDLLGASRVVRFRVDRSWRGGVSGTIEVRTGSGGGDCGYAFERGVKYLVYAHARAGALVTGICTRTKPLAEAAEDLAYVENAFRPSVAGEVFGKASYQRQTEGPARPIVGYTVTLAGEGRHLTARTDAEGRYSFKGIAVGSYAIALTVPEGEHAYGPREARLIDPRGCAAADFYVVADGRIALRVVDARGQPVNGLSLDIVRLDSITDGQYPDSRSIVTDADGRGEVAQLRPERYVVALNLTRAPNAKQPYPTLYFPGVTTLREARVIDLNLGERVDLDTFTLPSALESRPIAGTVRWPDGSPVEGALVTLRPAGGPLARVLESTSAKTGKDGVFSMRAPAGLRYSLSALVFVGTQDTPWATSGKEFVLDDATPLQTLTLAPAGVRR